MPSLVSTNPPFQFAWHVPDMDDAIHHWSNTLGVGPFFTTTVDSSTRPGFSYRGGPGTLVSTVAWAESPQGQIELIEVHSDAPNVYHDLVAPDRTGFHHVGVWTDRYQHDKDRLAEQFELAMDMGTQTNICYFDTSPDTGNMLELIERNESILHLFASIRSAADTWDGTRPRRDVAELFQ